MALTRVRVSDISGAFLDDRDSAQIRVVYSDRRRGVRIVDATIEEADALLGKFGTLQKQRGPRPRRPEPEPEPEAYSSP